MKKLFKKIDFLEISWLEGWRPYFLIFAIGFLLYSQTLFFDFTYFDDSTLILEKTEILSDFKNINLLFSTDAFFSGVKIYYRPLLNLSFMLDAQADATLPVFYHLSNILIHCLASILVFLLLTKLINKRSLAFFLSLIFLIHPIMTQAVAWIPGRNDSLLAVFVLASFILFLEFLRRPRLLYYLGYLFFLFCSLFTKESAVALPVLVILYFLFIDGGFLKRSDKWLLVAGSAVTGFVWFLSRTLALGSGSVDYLSALEGIVKNSPALLVAVGKLIFPFNLSVLPILEDSTLVYGLIALPILILALIFSRGKRINRLIFGAGWFLMFLLPSFIRFNDQPDFLEHRLYLPLVGFFLLIAEIDWIKELDFEKKKNKIISGLILILFLVLTINQSTYFKDQLVFWGRAAQDSPHSALAHRNLGAMYYFAGRKDEAVVEYKKSLALNEGEEMAHNNLGVIYMERGDLVAAEEEFKKELSINPGYDRALFNLGDLYYRQDKKSEAAKFWLQAAKSNPYNPEIYQRLLIFDKQLK
ncbi:MAG: tetratricopeptide repeat protein [Patescibacteria group bacterium]